MFAGVGTYHERITKRMENTEITFTRFHPNKIHKMENVLDEFKVLKEKILMELNQK